MTSILWRHGPWPPPQAHLMPLSCHLCTGRNFWSVLKTVLHSHAYAMAHGLPVVWGVSACSVTQLCPTVSNLMDHSSPVSSVHGIFPAGILEWVAFLSPRDLPCILIVPSNMRLKKLRAISDDRVLVFWLIQLSWWKTSWLRKRINRRTGLWKEKINRVLNVWSLRDLGDVY